jgi:hypothetical protein
MWYALRIVRSAHLNDQEIALRLHLLHGAGHPGNAAVRHDRTTIHPILRTPAADKAMNERRMGAIMTFIGMVFVYVLMGLIGTYYISGQCKEHGYNGGGLDWDYTRYCNAEHFTTVPGPRHIPYSEVVR